MIIKYLIINILLLGFSFGFLKNYHLQQKYKQPLKKQASQTFDKQILDHFDSSEPKTYWSQNYWILDKFYDRNRGPLFLYICGEAQCSGISEQTGYIYNLAEKYNGIAISIEHRFYGSSQPFGHNNETYSTENLRYLSQNQALSDLAVFVKFLKDNQIAGISQDTPIITVGGSYPGALSAWFRYKYPHLTIGAYASSAVVNAIDDYFYYDKQVGITLENYGDCKQNVQNMNKYFVEQLKTPQSNHKIKAQFGAQNLSDNAFLEMVSSLPQGEVQFGEAAKYCGLIQGQSLQTQLSILGFMIYGAASEFTIESYQYTQFNAQANQRQWYYQLCTNFGWSQTSYTKDPIKPPSLNLEYYHNLCKQIFGEEYLSNVQVTDNMMGGLDMRINNIVFTNGSEDPWQWATFRQTVSQMNSYMANCKGCSHTVDLSKPQENDPQSLKQVRRHVENHIDQWLAEYRQQLFGDNINDINFRYKQWDYESEEN